MRSITQTSVVTPGKAKLEATTWVEMPSTRGDIMKEMDWQAK